MTSLMQALRKHQDEEMLSEMYRARPLSERTIRGVASKWAASLSEVTVSKRRNKLGGGSTSNGSSCVTVEMPSTESVSSQAGR